MHRAVVALLFAAGVASAAPAPNGKLIYTASCAGCHGLKGEGGTGGLSPNMKATQKASFTLFRRAMQQGIGFAGQKFQPVMPTFGKTGLATAYGKRPTGKAPSETELKALYRYIRTLPVK
ncbi:MULTISPECIES: c-type cytochrome [Deinococcus]|uniref:Cytochrome c domain-containing protein n=1 Tax=Deinococcus cavernae TaxID=2320857 RepID=A0A418V9Q4_9DEIO|nr:MULTISPECIES: c-type cytochrome [Deinococcus]RJF72787.1 hypothetical protein D3875_15800 [Deinococcus cavernae]